MSENLTPEQPSILDEQIGNELVKGNVTEAIISSLKERYMHLSIKDAEDKKEVYLQVKEGRKEAKALRVLASKICKKGREDLVKMQKAWVKKEEQVTARISEVEDYLEVQEKEYEAEVAKEKEARKRKQEEQLIVRQQTLTNMGALYADGAFTLGEVSFDLAAIKESEEDIWAETILPKYQEEYSIIEGQRIEQEAIKREQEAELKRQQEELEAERKRLKEEADRLKAEADRQAEAKRKSRVDQLTTLGLLPDFSDKHYKGFGVYVSFLDIEGYSDDMWAAMIEESAFSIARKREEEAEQKRIEQERNELQNKRYAELLPFKGHGEPVDMDSLWSLSEEQYISVLSKASHAFNRAEEEKAQKIAEEAARKERERIEEEQRQAEIKRKNNLRDSRIAMLKEHDLTHPAKESMLGEISEETWINDFNELKAHRDEIIRKQEEERKAEELAQATENVKWTSFIAALTLLKIPDFKSGQYRKKAAILREKLEEIKAL